MSGINGCVFLPDPVRYQLGLRISFGRRDSVIRTVGRTGRGLGGRGRRRARPRTRQTECPGTSISRCWRSARPRPPAALLLFLSPHRRARGSPVKIFLQMPAPATAAARFESQIVPLLRPKILVALPLRPRTRSTARLEIS